MHDTADARLHEIFRHGNRVLFCGAGISMDPPAGLPDWHLLRDETIHAIASQDAYLDKFVQTLTTVPMIGMPGKRGLTPEIVASAISSRCEGYFESFRALE